MNRREEIMQRSFKLFSEKGYNLSLAEIAAGIGMRKQSLYYYYSSKEVLIDAVVRQEVDSYFKLMELELESLEELPAVMKLDKLFRTIVGHFRDIEKLRFWRWMMFFGDDTDQAQSVRSLVAEREQHFNRLVRSVVLDGMEEGTILNSDPRNVMVLYVTLLQGVLDIILMFRDPQMIEDSVTMVLEGFWASVRA